MPINPNSTCFRAVLILDPYLLENTTIPHGCNFLMRPQSPPNKFKQVWTCPGKPDHTQPTLAVLDVIFP